MVTGTAKSSPAIKLLPQAVCPHCWERFAPEQVLWVSEHVELLGDARLGPEQQQRFLPSRYTPEGDAIDARGMTCRTLACPKCHLGVPRGMLEMEPLFLSILGAPSSGKSYFLTAMTWQLRKVLPLSFSVSFSDADPAANRALNECEESLFLHANPDAMVPLGNMIRKTELQGELYDSVAYGEQTVIYPRPFLFTMQMQSSHPNAAKSAALSRILCLYDNAGEHFLPGQDTTASPVTRHLALSRVVLFLFDPTQDQRFRSACRHASTMKERRSGRQELILNEAASRLRRLASRAHDAKNDRPLVVVVSKYDEWSSLLGASDGGDPWKTSPSGLSGLDVELIEQQSANVRRLLVHYCPEIVTAAEGFSTDVTYIPVSSLGDRVRVDPTTGLASIRPQNVRPHWATAPLLYSVCRALPGLIPKLVKRPRKTGA